MKSGRFSSSKGCRHSAAALAVMVRPPLASRVIQPFWIRWLTLRRTVSRGMPVDELIENALQGRSGSRSKASP